MPNTTHSLSGRPTANRRSWYDTHIHRRTCPTPHTQISPADRQLLGIPRMTHAQTDRPAQHHALTLSSRPTATRRSSYDTRTNRQTCPTPHTQISPADRQLLSIPRITHTQTDEPAQRTHSLSPADRQLIGIPHMTHTQTDGPAQHHTLNLSSRPTATRHSSYDTRTNDGPAQHHTLTLQQIDSYSAFLV